jgi:hypothetical protein
LASRPFFVEKREKAELSKNLIIWKEGAFGYYPKNSLFLLSFFRRKKEQNSQTKPSKKLRFLEASYKKARNLRRRFLPKAKLALKAEGFVWEEEPFFGNRRFWIRACRKIYDFLEAPSFFTNLRLGTGLEACCPLPTL